MFTEAGTHYLLDKISQLGSCRTGEFKCGLLLTPELAPSGGELVPTLLSVSHGLQELPGSVLHFRSLPTHACYFRDAQIYAEQMKLSQAGSLYWSYVEPPL